MPESGLALPRWKKASSCLVGRVRYAFVCLVGLYTLLESNRSKWYVQYNDNISNVYATNLYMGTKVRVSLFDSVTVVSHKDDM